MYPTISIGKIIIPLYGTMTVVGIVAGFLLLFLTLKKDKVKIGIVPFGLVILSSLLVAYFGAALWDTFSHYLETGELHGGISVMGGILFAVPAVYLSTLLITKDRQARNYMVNAIVPGATLGQAFGRIGCLFGGCCYGSPSSIGFGIVYPEGSDAAKMFGYGVPLIPVPIYEAIILLVLSMLLFFFVKKERIIVYLYSYSIWRFVIEFFRGDDRGTTVFKILSPAQFICIILIIIATIMLIYRINKKETSFSLDYVNTCIVEARKKNEEEKTRRQQIYDEVNGIVRERNDNAMGEDSLEQ